jgi:hypothetical protein
MRVLVVGGTASGVGKTSLTLGIMVTLRWARRPPRERGRGAPLPWDSHAVESAPRRRLGLSVQPFKVGPGGLGG